MQMAAAMETMVATGTETTEVHTAVTMQPKMCHSNRISHSMSTTRERPKGTLVMVVAVAKIHLISNATTVERWATMQTSVHTNKRDNQKCNLPKLKHLMMTMIVMKLFMQLEASLLTASDAQHQIRNERLDIAGYWKLDRYLL